MKTWLWRVGLRRVMCIWKNGGWVGQRVPLLMTGYALLAVPVMLIQSLRPFIPRRLVSAHLGLVIFDAAYCLCCAVASKRDYDFYNRKFEKSRQELLDGLRPLLVRLSVLLNYRDRPNVVEIAQAAHVVSACREFGLEGCEVELRLVEAWVRYWDEEKVSQ